MEQITTNTHGPFRSERSGAEREEEIKILKRKRFSISLHALTEWGMEWNGMEWNGMKQNETERNRMKQNETERNRMKQNEMEQIRTNTHGPFRSERSGAGRRD